MGEPSIMNMVIEKLGQTDRKGRNLWVIKEEIKYHVPGVGTVVVPEGHITNFGSIPRFAYPLITPTEMGEAAAVHDYLVDEQFKDVDDGIEDPMTPRVVADAILYNHLRSVGIGPIRASLIYYAVRAYALATGKK